MAGCEVCCKWFPPGDEDMIKGIKAYCKEHKIPFAFILFESGEFEFIFRDIHKFPIHRDGEHFLPQDTGGIEGYSLDKLKYSIIVDDLTSGEIIKFESYNKENLYD